MIKKPKKKTMKQLRESAGLTQKDVADSLGITPRHYQRIEASNRPRQCYHTDLKKLIGFVP